MSETIESPASETTEAQPVTSDAPPRLAWESSGGEDVHAFLELGSVQKTFEVDKVLHSDGREPTWLISGNGTDGRTDECLTDYLTAEDAKDQCQMIADDLWRADFLPPAGETAPGPEAAAGAADAAAAKKPGRKKKGPPVEIEIPARLLYVVGVAGKEDTRYQMAGVLVETRDVEGLVSAAATDGRRLIIAECNRGMFDGVAVVYVPRDVILAAVRIAIARPQDDESGAVVTIRRHGDDCHLTAYAAYGPAVFEWQMDPDQVFPPYRSVIPDFADSVGAGRIGITSELVSGTLRTLQKVVGKEPKVKVYLPPSADRPIGLESQDGDSIKALAIVMPTSIGDWADKPAPVKGEEPPVDPNQQTIPTGAPAADDDSWRAVLLSTLTPAIPAKKLALLAENTPPLTTMGELADWQAKESDPWWWKDIRGLGEGGMTAVVAAQDTYWVANRRLAVPAPAAEPCSEPCEIMPNPIQQESSTAASPTESPDDFEDRIDESTRETVATIEKHLVIEVARRMNGLWQTGTWISIGNKLDKSRPFGTCHQEASRAAAIEAAVKFCRDELSAVRGELKGKAEQTAIAITWELDALEKKEAASGKGRERKTA